MRQSLPLGQKINRARARFRKAVNLWADTPMENLVKSLEVLTGIVENMWKPDAGAPPDSLVSAIQDSKMLIQASSEMMAQEGSAAWSDMGDGDDERMTKFEDVHASGGAPRPGQATAATKYSIPLNAATPTVKETAHNGIGLGRGGKHEGNFDQLFVRGVHKPKDVELGGN